MEYNYHCFSAASSQINSQRNAPYPGNSHDDSAYIKFNAINAPHQAFDPSSYDYAIAGKAGDKLLPSPD